MNENPKSKPFQGLEDRTLRFAERSRNYVKLLPKNTHNIEYGKQLIRSSGSQAANYIEANESISRKDFILRVRISRKETKESCLWLRLSEPSSTQETEQATLIQEGIELQKIFGSIIEKSSKS